MPPEERGAGVADDLDEPLDVLRDAWEHGLPRALGDDLWRPEPNGLRPEPTGWRPEPTGRRASTMCGVVGIHAPGQEAAPLAALGLFALQHRGQESAGHRGQRP